MKTYPDVSYVYLMRRLDAPMFKIGYTSQNPEKRASQLQKNNLFKVHIRLEVLSYLEFESVHDAIDNEYLLKYYCKSRGLLKAGNEWLRFLDDNVMCYFGGGYLCWEWGI